LFFKVKKKTEKVHLFTGKPYTVPGNLYPADAKLGEGEEGVGGEGGC
jgi:hypothetical protein